MDDLATKDDSVHTGRCICLGPSGRWSLLCFHDFPISGIWSVTKAPIQIYEPFQNPPHHPRRVPSICGRNSENFPESKPGSLHDSNPWPLTISSYLIFIFSIWLLFKSWRTLCRAVCKSLRKSEDWCSKFPPQLPKQQVTDENWMVSLSIERWWGYVELVMDQTQGILNITNTQSWICIPPLNGLIGFGPIQISYFPPQQSDVFCCDCHIIASSAVDTQALSPNHSAGCSWWEYQPQIRKQLVSNSCLIRPVPPKLKSSYSLFPVKHRDMLILEPHHGNVWKLLASHIYMVVS